MGTADICFIPDGNYKKFLEENSDIKPKEGNIVNKDGKVLGKHTGLYNYTIGQRKGLGISNPVPLFVLGFEASKNEVIVGEEHELYSNEILVKDVNGIKFAFLAYTYGTNGITVPKDKSYCVNLIDKDLTKIKIK